MPIAGVVLAVPADPVCFLALVEGTTASWLYIVVGGLRRLVALYADSRNADTTPVTDDGCGQIGGGGDGDSCAGGDAGGGNQGSDLSGGQGFGCGRAGGRVSGGGEALHQGMPAVPCEQKSGLG